MAAMNTSDGFLILNQIFRLLRPTNVLSVVSYISVCRHTVRHFPAGVLVSPSYFAIANPDSFNSSCKSQILQGSCHNLAHLFVSL
jgi:hypothetical protein